MNKLRGTRRGQQDPAMPQFVRLVDDHGLMFGGSSDADRDYVAIDPARSYLIAGVRGTGIFQGG